jgi:hypothetical protein
VGAEGGVPDAGSGGDGSSGDGTTAMPDSTAGGDDGGSATACSSLPLCDDFESDTAGSAPSSTLWTLIGTAGCSGVGNPAATTLYPIVVDSTQHHSGSNSVKVTGGDGCGAIMNNTSAFAKLGTGDVYGRFYVFMPLTNPVTFDHTVVAALNLGTTALNPDNQGTYLELASEGAGNATNVFMWQTMDSNILPDKQTSGGAASAYPAPSTWTCVEFHTAPSGTLETWVNGTPITGLTFIPGTTAAMSGVNNAWKPLSPFNPTSFGLGWVVFSGPAPYTLWFDDVALSTTRITCN